jgi:hypothetical protein
MSKYRNPIGGSGKRTTNLFYRSGISSLLSRIEKLENQVFCCSDDTHKVISITTATHQANANTEDGAHFYFNRAAGVVLTIPQATADNIGWNCTVSLGTTGTGTQTIKTGSTSDLYIGGINMVDPGTAGDMYFAAPDYSNDDQIDMAAIETGWLKGGRVEIEIVGVNKVLATGTLIGDATLANPFD